MVQNSKIGLFPFLCIKYYRISRWWPLERLTVFALSLNKEQLVSGTVLAMKIVIAYREICLFYTKFTANTMLLREALAMSHCFHM